MEYKMLIPQVSGTTPLEDAAAFDRMGADQIMILSDCEGLTGGMISAMKKVTDVPVIVCIEAVDQELGKRAMQAGADQICLKKESITAEEADQMIQCYGSEKASLYVDGAKGNDFASYKEAGITTIYIENLSEKAPEGFETVVAAGAKADAQALLSVEGVSGIAVTDSTPFDINQWKRELEESDIVVNSFCSTLEYKDFKLNSDDMIPVVTQDYETGEVLMVAYMNQLAFETTVRTGKMTYWSRSRNELWTKGDTSGHLQYIKSLLIDCDNDTILAKVIQIGAACHTGNRTCFYRELVKRKF